MLVRKSVAVGEGVEGLARSSGIGTAAVMVCRPACISVVRHRRAVLMNFLIGQPSYIICPGKAGKPSGIHMNIRYIRANPPT